jgi:hypothetical protein
MIDGAGRRWTLNRNKTDSEDLYEVLNSDYMQTVMRPILEKLRTRSQSVALRIAMGVVNTVMGSLLTTIQVRLSETETEPVHHREGERHPERIIDPHRRQRGGEHTRPRRIEDTTSSLTARLRRAREINVKRFETRGEGLGFVTFSQENTIITIYIEASTQIGKAIWASTTRLVDHAIHILAVYLGAETDIREQIKLRLPIDPGDTGPKRIEKIVMFLLENTDMSLLEQSAAA